MVICTLLNLVTPEITHNMVDYIKQSQTYEGGISSTPGLEAHGGYTYCAIAALYLLKEVKSLDKTQLLCWMTARQMAVEGGFQGRENKLVDGCYSFWVGALFPIVDLESSVNGLLSNTYFDRDALQRYLLGCCQGVKGGMRDKPGK